MSKEQLRPCACGEIPKLWSETIPTLDGESFLARYYVQCPKCGTRTKPCSFIQDSITIWNRRKFIKRRNK